MQRRRNDEGADRMGGGLAAKERRVDGERQKFVARLVVKIFPRQRTQQRRVAKTDLHAQAGAAGVGKAPAFLPQFKDRARKDRVEQLAADLAGKGELGAAQRIIVARVDEQTLNDGVLVAALQWRIERNRRRSRRRLAHRGAIAILGEVEQHIENPFSRHNRIIVACPEMSVKEGFANLLIRSIIDGKSY